MSKTTIEWTQRPGTVGETWNPTTGCNKVDRGCKNCYAETMHKRLQAMGQEKYAQAFLAGAVEHPDTLTIPFRWKKPRTVFVNSMSDLFHRDVSHYFQQRVISVVRATPQHTYLLLTKRPENLLYYQEVQQCAFPGWKFPPNLWVGTSVHDQESAQLRVPLLQKVDVEVRFLSYEPAIGPLDLLKVDLPVGKGARSCLLDLHWVICGGESGPKAMPMHPDWARKVRDDCEMASVPFFFKQWGMWQLAEELPAQQPGERRRCCHAYHRGTTPTKYVHRQKKSGNLLDGKLHQAFPH